jgi:hypothetical protein
MHSASKNMIGPTSSWVALKETKERLILTRGVQR